MAWRYGGGGVEEPCEWWLLIFLLLLTRSGSQRKGVTYYEAFSYSYLIF